MAGCGERSMSTDFSARQTAQRVRELADEFSGWRIGRGGSGLWWAVRGNELVRSGDVEELRTRLYELGSARQQA
jgi:hypothetical protein